MTFRNRIGGYIAAAVLFCTFAATGTSSLAAEYDENINAEDTDELHGGGGFAATNQLGDVGYMAVLYDALNGMPTSEANCVLGASDGYVWVGGYSGILKYDGSEFERIPASSGLTNGRYLYEDSLGRIWVATNDNGVVVMDDEEYTRYSKDEGLSSNSIRAFAEDKQGNVYIGSTAGVAYVDADMILHIVDDERINNERVLKLITDVAGRIFGQTKNGYIFELAQGRVVSFYSSADLGIKEITTILADPKIPGRVYLGTEGDSIYYGNFGDDAERLKQISVFPIKNVHWMSYECGRIWVASDSVIGYLDETEAVHILKDLPMVYSIEMMTSDYQGNMWFASSRQGIMKIVVNNFQNYTALSGIPDEVVNVACFYNNDLYVGTDSGLHIVSNGHKSITNELTNLIGTARIRAITEDRNGDLWLATFTGDHGLIRYGKDKSITEYTIENGMPGNEIRCIYEKRDGTLLVGTNDGIALLRDGAVISTVGSKEGMKNTVILTICEGDNDEIYAGSDGDGFYIIDENGIRSLREGLTSDVIMRIRRDDRQDLYWIITSNSIEYMKDGRITNVSTFPYNNVFDIFADREGDYWIMSSQGVYMARASEMLGDDLRDYRLFTMANGLTSIPVAHSYSCLDDNGNLYIAGKTGVSRVNVDNYHLATSEIKTHIGEILFDGEKLLPDSSGNYVIPAGNGRIEIEPEVLDYTMTNPTVHVYLEGASDAGITTELSKLKDLEFTSLSYGNYVLHIQILNSLGEAVSDDTFNIKKEPHFFELMAVRILLLAMLAAIAGITVWRVMDGTIIRRQYQQIQDAKDEAERANLAKSRFLANMSHEIRTPINTILGMDEMIIREDAKNVPDNYYLSVMGYALDIKSATDSLLSLINDLLDISKIESGKMHLVEQEYDVVEMLRSVIKMIRVRAESKKLYFYVEVDPDTPKRLYGDEGKIKQVVLNLLTNAVKYTDDGGFTLKVSVSSRDELACRLRISVKDTGIGVKKEDLEKLFSAYERLDEEKNSAIQGTGLGLDISRQFAELMNGKLWCESEYGEGSEFILTLSQKIIDESGIGLFREEDDTASKGPYIPKFIAPDADILVVDDNPMNLTVIKGLLKPTRMFITTAGSGEECLEKLRTGSFNVVLLDHMMPGMDGIETLEQIRKKYPDLPVYALTANGTAGEDFYKSKGFNGYLSKPIDTVQVEKAIMRHLPENIMMQPSESDEVPVEDDNALNDDCKWLYEVEGISVDEGIRNCGGAAAYMNSLHMFLDTMEDNIKVIRDAFDNGDLRLYTVKVHALKSSARIVGALEMSQLCQQLEDAGNGNDLDFIVDNTDRLLADYQAFGDKLSRLSAGEADDEDKPEMPQEELKDAMAALSEQVSQMDQDGVEMILEQLREYKLPDNEASRIKGLEKALKVFDWDEMERIMNDV